MTAVEEDRENTWKRQVGTEDWGEENMEARFRKFLENGNGRRNVHRLTRVSLVTAYCSERVFFIRPSPTRTQSARPCLHGWSFNLRPAKKNGQIGSGHLQLQASSSFMQVSIPQTASTVNTFREASGRLSGLIVLSNS